MANSKFRVEKLINHGEWLKGCPVYLVRSQIILNTETSKKCIVNEMANIGEKEIKDVIIKIECLDETGAVVQTVDNCAYQEVKAAKQSVFGGNKLFGIADETVSVSIIIKGVRYVDGTTWSNDYLIKGIKVDAPVKIDPQDPAYEMAASRCKERGVTPKFWPKEFPGGWRCTCGQLNDEENMSCSMCGSSKFWILDNLNREDIIEYKERVEREIRLRLEREEEERRLAAEREEEERRLAAEREAEERRLAAEREEAERIRLEEEARLAAERESEEARLAEERAIEEAKRLEAEKKAAEERERLELLMAKKEAVRQYNMQLQRKSVGKGVVAAIVAVVAVVVVIGVFNFIQWMRIDERYESAQKYVDNYNYKEAIAVYQGLGNYKDAPEKVLETKYAYAEYLSVIGDYQASIDLYTQLGNYNDSASHIPAVYLKKAEAARENKQYAEAFEFYEKAGNLVDEAYMASLNFEYAGYLKDMGNYQEAVERYSNTGEMAGSMTQIAECYYLLGKQQLNQSRFDDAIDSFTHCYGVEDTVELNKEAYYLKGNKLQTAGDVEGAYYCFLNAGDYSDAAEKKADLTYDLGMIRLKEKNYNAAYILLSSLDQEVENLDEILGDAKYEYAESMLANNIDKSLLEIYKSLPKDHENVKDRISMIEKYIDYVGTYATDDKDAKTKEVVVKFTIQNDTPELRANGEVLDIDSLSSEKCKITNKTTLKYTDTDGTTYTYKK
ncbi:MAG: hypothetical protein ACI4AQ_03015 [Lachnospiraceae bacterium]